MVLATALSLPAGMLVGVVILTMDSILYVMTYLVVALSLILLLASALRYSDREKMGAMLVFFLGILITFWLV